MPPPIRQRIIVDTTGVRIGYKEAASEARKYSRDARGRFVAVGDEAEKQARRSGAAFSKMAKGMAVGAIALAARMVGRIAQAVYKLGSQAEDTGTRFDTVFGRMSERMARFLDPLIRQTKLMRHEGQAAAASLGATFIGLGADLERSTRYTETALDTAFALARFYGKDANEAIAAVTSGVTGEMQALKSLNIVVREREALEAALNLSRKGSVSELTELERAHGRLIVIQGQANQQMGHMGRTMTTNASAASQLAGRFRRAWETIARDVSPLIRDLIDQTNRDLESLESSGVLSKLWGGFKDVVIDPARRAIAVMGELPTITRAAALEMVNHFRTGAVRIEAALREGLIRGLTGPLQHPIVLRALEAITGQKALGPSFDALAGSLGERELETSARLAELDAERLEIAKERERIFQRIGEKLLEIEFGAERPERPTLTPPGGAGRRRTERAHLVQGLSVDAVKAIQDRYREFENTVTRIQASVLSKQVSIEDGFKAQAIAAAIAGQEITDTYNGLMAGLNLSETEMLELHAAFVEIMSGVQDVSEEATKGLKDTSKETGVVAKVLSGQLARAWARAADGATQMLRALGLLDEKTGRVLDSARAAADAYAELMSVRQAIGAGELIGTAATLATGAAGVGLIASTIGLVSGLFSGGDSQVEAIRENTRRIEDAIRELGEQMREAPNLSSNDASAIARAFYAASFQSTAIGPGTARGPGGTNVDRARQLYESFFTLLEEAGYDASAFRGNLDALLGILGNPFRSGDVDPVTGYPVPGADFFQAQADLAALNELIHEFISGIDEPGRPTDTVQGILGGTAMLHGFGAISGPEAIQRILGLLSGLGEDLGDFAESISDLQDAADEDAIRAIIAQVAEGIAAGTFDTGGLTAEHLEDILSALQGFLGSGTSGETAIVRQIQQTITTFQANALIVLGEETVYQLRQINATLSGLVDVPKIGPPVLNPVSTSNSVTFGPVTVHGQLSEAGIREASRQFEQHIREKTLIRP